MSTHNIGFYEEISKIIPYLSSNTHHISSSAYSHALLLVISLVMRKPAFCICEKKDADQLRGNREADQRLCFRYIASTIPLLPKSEISSL